MSNRQAQCLLSHSRATTTTAVYQQVIPEAVENMVDSIHDELRKPSIAVAETHKLAANCARKQGAVAACAIAQN